MYFLLTEQFNEGVPSLWVAFLQEVILGFRFLYCGSIPHRDMEILVPKQRKGKVCKLVMNQDQLCLHFYWQKQLLLPFTVTVKFCLKSHSILITVALIRKEVNIIEEKQVSRKQLQDILKRKTKQNKKNPEFSYLSYKRKY